ncbi:hypothetical protein TNCV_3018071 [Trichonephila clavipes]|nr:hypothetical protein TNCV_3018071 [Trichonephila clavipes]
MCYLFLVIRFIRQLVLLHKTQVFVPPLPRDVAELHERITRTVNNDGGHPKLSCGPPVDGNRRNIHPGPKSSRGFRLCPDDNRRRVWRRPGQLGDPAKIIAIPKGTEQRLCYTKAFGDRLRKFVQWSSKKNDTRASTPSPNFPATSMAGHLGLGRFHLLHGGSSAVSGSNSQHASQESIT